jgi:hypothetical protein
MWSNCHVVLQFTVTLLIFQHLKRWKCFFLLTFQNGDSDDRNGSKLTFISRRHPLFHMKWKSIAGDSLTLNVGTVYLMMWEDFLSFSRECIHQLTGSKTSPCIWTAVSFLYLVIIWETGTFKFKFDFKMKWIRHFCNSTVHSFSEW